MQMQNGKISLRQYKRLLFFDMVGLGLVILADVLSSWEPCSPACMAGFCLPVCGAGYVIGPGSIFPMGSICFSWEPLGYTFWQTWCIPSCCRRSPFSCSQS